MPDLPPLPRQPVRLQESPSRQPEAELLEVTGQSCYSLGQCVGGCLLANLLTVAVLHLIGWIG